MTEPASDTVVNIPESSGMAGSRPVAEGHLRGGGSNGADGNCSGVDINAKGYITYGPLPNRGKLNEREAALTERAFEVQQLLQTVKRNQAVESGNHSPNSGDGDSGRGASDDGADLHNKTSPHSKPPPHYESIYDPRRARTLGRDEVEKCSICSDPPDEREKGVALMSNYDYPDVAKETIPLVTIKGMSAGGAGGGGGGGGGPSSQTLPRYSSMNPPTKYTTNPKFSASTENLNASPELSKYPVIVNGKIKDDSKVRLISPDVRNHRKPPGTFRTFGPIGPNDRDARDPRDPRGAQHPRGYNLYVY